MEFNGFCCLKLLYVLVSMKNCDFIKGLPKSVVNHLWDLHVLNETYKAANRFITKKYPQLGLFT